MSLTHDVHTHTGGIGGRFCVLDRCNREPAPGVPLQIVCGAPRDAPCGVLQLAYHFFFLPPFSAPPPGFPTGSSGSHGAMKLMCTISFSMNS